MNKQDICIKYDIRYDQNLKLSSTNNMKSVVCNIILFTANNNFLVYFKSRYVENNRLFEIYPLSNEYKYELHDRSNDYVCVVLTTHDKSVEIFLYIRFANDTHITYSCKYTYNTYCTSLCDNITYRLEYCVLPKFSKFLKNIECGYDYSKKQISIDQVLIDNNVFKTFKNMQEMCNLEQVNKTVLTYNELVQNYITLQDYTRKIQQIHENIKSENNKIENIINSIDEQNNNKIECRICLNLKCNYILTCGHFLCLECINKLSATKLNRQNERVTCS